MPKSMLDKLPSKARDIYEAAWKSAQEQGRDEESSAKIAISAVKRAGYEKDDDGRWRKKAMHTVSLYITKATLGGDGVMRWRATVSKFGPDQQGDEITPAFFKYAAQQVMSGRRPSPVLCVSHIDNGKPDDSWVAGDVTDLYVDNAQPKAKGSFRDTVLGKAAFQGVRDDWSRGTPVGERVRVSLGFFSEESKALTVQKADGTETTGRQFLKGWIKHLALTRVPVVGETNITADMEEKMTKVTKLEDAASIVGEELAAELVREEKAELDDDLILKADEDEKETEEEKETETEKETEKGDEEKDKAVVIKAETRQNQILGLLGQLASLLQVEWTVDTEIANAAALGNKGTNPPRAEAVKSQVDEPQASVDDEPQAPEKSQAENTLASIAADPPLPEAVEVAAFVDEFATRIKATLLSDGDRHDKFAALQRHLDAFGKGVPGLVKEGTEPSARDIGDVVGQAVRAAVEPVRIELAGVKADLDTLKSKAVLGTAVEPPAPEPRSLDRKARVVENDGPLVQKRWTAAELAYASTGPVY